MPFEAIVKLSSAEDDSTWSFNRIDYRWRTSQALDSCHVKAGKSAMDSTLTSVLAALSGSIIGASTPVLSNFVLQRSVTQRELTNREIAQREELYSEFIRQGTACYAKALLQSLDTIEDLTAMYALVNRIRLFASSSVLEAADAFVRNLVERYGEKNMSIEELASLALRQHPDPLNDFALKCRTELHKMYAQSSWRNR